MIKNYGNINKSLDNLMKKVLNEVDSDIADIFSAEWIDFDGEIFPAWYLLQNPTMTAIEWQLMRLKQNEIKAKN